MIPNGTDAKDIALHYLHKKNETITKYNIGVNISIAKSILSMGYVKRHIIMAIDLYYDKMYSLNFIKCILDDVVNACNAEDKQREIEVAKEARTNEKIIYSEVDADGVNRNKQKLERGNNVSRERKTNPFDTLK